MPFPSTGHAHCNLQRRAISAVPLFVRYFLTQFNLETARWNSGSKFVLDLHFIACFSEQQVLSVASLTQRVIHVLIVYHTFWFLSFRSIISTSSHALPLAAHDATLTTSTNVSTCKFACDLDLTWPDTWRHWPDHRASLPVTVLFSPTRK